MGKHKAIPDGWQDYKAFGKPVPGTRFLPFKTPLKASGQRLKEEFTVEYLLKNQPNLKAVINLTNTTRYYNPSEFMDKGVLYSKINVPGHILPSKNLVLCFFDTVDRFLRTFKNDANALIGVHCTHGLNRTGYLICKYMVARMKINPEQAIKDFQQARGYEIERQNYIDDVRGVKSDQQNQKIKATSKNRKINNKTPIKLQPARYKIEKKNHERRNKKIETIIKNKKKTNFFIDFQRSSDHDIERKNHDIYDVQNQETTSNNKQRDHFFRDFKRADGYEMERKNQHIHFTKHDSQNQKIEVTSNNKRRDNCFIDFKRAGDYKIERKNDVYSKKNEATLNDKKDYSFIDFQQGNNLTVEKKNQDIHVTKHDVQHRKIEATSNNKQRGHIFTDFERADDYEMERKNHDRHDVKNQKIETIIKNKKKSKFFIDFQRSSDHVIERKNHDLDDVQNQKIEATSNNKRRNNYIQKIEDSTEIFEQSNINNNSRKEIPINSKEDVPEDRQHPSSFKRKKRNNSQTTAWNSNYNSRKIDEQDGRKRHSEVGNYSQNRRDYQDVNRDNSQRTHWFFTDDGNSVSKRLKWEEV